MLRRRRPHPRAEPSREDDGCQARCVHVLSRNGWGARIRTWDRGTKTRCLTTWLRPSATKSAGYVPTGHVCQRLAATEEDESATAASAPDRDDRDSARTKNSDGNERNERLGHRGDPGDCGERRAESSPEPEVEGRSRDRDDDRERAAIAPKTNRIALDDGDPERDVVRWRSEPAARSRDAVFEDAAARPRRTLPPRIRYPGLARGPPARQRPRRLGSRRRARRRPGPRRSRPPGRRPESVQLAGVAAIARGRWAAARARSRGRCTRAGEPAPALLVEAFRSVARVEGVVDRRGRGLPPRAPGRRGRPSSPGAGRAASSSVPSPSPSCGPAVEEERDVGAEPGGEPWSRPRQRLRRAPRSRAGAPPPRRSCRRRGPPRPGSASRSSRASAARRRRRRRALERRATSVSLREAANLSSAQARARAGRELDPLEDRHHLVLPVGRAPARRRARGSAWRSRARSSSRARAASATNSGGASSSARAPAGRPIDGERRLGARRGPRARRARASSGSVFRRCANAASTTALTAAKSAGSGRAAERDQGRVDVRPRAEDRRARPDGSRSARRPAG